MFERATIDSVSGGKKSSYDVRIRLDDGALLNGKLHVPVTRGLDDEINGSDGFLDFEPYQGERMMIAKHIVRTITRTNMPTANQLQNSERRFDASDPYRILGLRPGSDSDAVKSAYRKLARSYHPDRFAAVELPKEVNDYLSAVARRINTAYGLLQSGKESLESRDAPQTCQPEYTRSPRANFGNGGRMHNCAET